MHYGASHDDGHNIDRYQCVKRYYMFEKKLTPSDVGKLNRLVVPKQYAEKYFPLVPAGSLLLSFLDESGKSWNFRYCYWKSSQSYVLTMGWSRFVKDKNLEAGDVVYFQRQLAEDHGGREQMYIGSRRQINIDVSNSPMNPIPTEHQPNSTHVKLKILRLFGVDIVECGSQQQEGEFEGDNSSPIL